MKKITILVVFALFILSCAQQQGAQKGDEILLFYTIKKQQGERIDNNVMPSGDTLPLRIVVGENYLLPGIEEQIVGMKKGEQKEFVLPPEKAYASKGIFYRDKNDSIYVVKPDEWLFVSLRVLEINKEY